MLHSKHLLSLGLIIKQALLTLCLFLSLQSSAIHSPPTRKPTGPRPLTSGGAYSPSNIKRTRYRGSPMQIDYDDNY